MKAQKTLLSGKFIGLRGALAIRILGAVCLVALVAVGPHAWRARAATNRIVAPYGSDTSNDCSNPMSPCLTIQHAVNQSSSGDTIILSPGLYQENVTVSQNVIIEGAGSTVNGSTVDGTNTGSVFNINGGISATLAFMTITHGNASQNGGGGILNNGSLTVIQSTISGNIVSYFLGAGGGIANNGSLTVRQSTISTNSAGNSGGQGGGIFNNGSLTVVQSTINGNNAVTGGGILSRVGASLTLTNSTIHGNSAFGAGGVGSYGTGTVVNSTITGNLAASASIGGGVGGLDNGLGMLKLINTIIAGNSNGDCNTSVFPIATNDRNLIGDGSLGPAVSGDPKLGPLQDNGGPTFTRALLMGSPAIDAGDDSVLGAPFNLSTDQRDVGFPRKLGAHVDIGAFERPCSPPSITLNPPSQLASGGSVSFTASASGDPTPTVQWQLSTDGGATFSNIPGATSTTLTFTPTPSQSGSRYRAAFTNGCGTATTTATTLTVLDACLRDNSTGNLLQWSSTTGQYKFTRCSDGFMLTGTGTVGQVNGIRTLSDFKSDRRLSAGFNTGQLTGNATIYLMVAQGVWQTFRIVDTNPAATCSCGP